MRTGFLGQAYASRSPILSSQTAINVYPALLPGGEGREVGAFYGTPGRQSVFQGSGEVRGLWVSGTGSPGQYYLFAVIGNTVYRLSQSYTATSLGTLPNASGRVSMVDNGVQLAIAHQDGMHWVSLTGSAIAPVSGAPLGATLSALDDYVIFSASTGGQFGITALGNLSSINPLDVATAEGWPDDCVAVLADHREAILFGTETIEVWSDTGASLFPFERIPGGFIEQGLLAKWSPAKLDNSVFWLGRDRNGHGVIYRSNGYIPLRISTHPIEFAINQGTITDAIGFAYQEEGHAFYYLTFPIQGLTFVYDVSTQMWHQRAFQNQTSGALERDRSNCFAHFYDDNLVGDYTNGKIYRMDLDLTTDDGAPIYRERAWDLPDEAAEHRKVRIDYGELLAVTGDGDGSGGTPQVWIQTSRDAGRTWSYERFQTLGLIGQRKARARWRRLGSGRDWTLKVGTNMTGRVSWTDFYARGEAFDQ